MRPEIVPTEAQPIASDTWLIPMVAADPSGAFISAHSMVIRGSEPVLVDTSVSFGRDQWTEQAFSVVEPDDVRWIFVSHDDHDHIGNLLETLDRCPNATLVVNYGIVARLAGDVELPLERMRWVEPGGTLDVGDRVLQIVRPPLFDSPATRGLYDPTTRVLWAVDSFGSLLPGAVFDANDVPADLYDDSFFALNTWNTPWLEWVDADRFARHLRDTSELAVDVAASAHGPVHRGERITDAFSRTADLVGKPPPPMPDQEMLELVVAMLATSS